jgi:hypothetical protein
MRFAIEPAEVQFPTLPTWWEQDDCGLGSERKWCLKVVASVDDGRNHRAAAGWSADGEFRNDGTVRIGPTTQLPTAQMSDVT